MEIIHSNVCGPMSSNSLSGYAYYVSFIDDFSRKTWVYFMKNKDEVFSKFKEFKELCKESGIKRELSTPYNPQQNGIAERKNRTIMEATRVMLHDQDLPMHLWEEAA